MCEKVELRIIRCRDEMSGNGEERATDGENNDGDDEHHTYFQAT